MSVCANSADIWRCINDWQTIIAGGFATVAALIGGWLAYRGARHSADRQIRALQEQNAELKRAEQRSVASVLHVSMALVATDVKTGISRLNQEFHREPSGLSDAQTTTSIRRAVGKYGFDYLRERLGHCEREDIVTAFLVLEREIDQLWAEEDPTTVGYWLNDLAQKADQLKTLAARELARAKPALLEAERPEHP